MPALQHDIVIEKGATFERVFSCTVIATGEPFDATHCNISVTVIGLGTLDFETFGTVGSVRIRLSDEQTGTLPIGRAVHRSYKIEVDTADGDVYRIAEGNITIK